MNYSDELMEFIIKYSPIVINKQNNRKLCFSLVSKYVRNGAISEALQEELFVLDFKLYDNDNQFGMLLTDKGLELFNTINIIGEL